MPYWLFPIIMLLLSICQHHTHWPLNYINSIIWTHTWPISLACQTLQLPEMNAVDHQYVEIPSLMLLHCEHALLLFNLLIFFFFLERLGLKKQLHCMQQWCFRMILCSALVVQRHYPMKPATQWCQNAVSLAVLMCSVFDGTSAGSNRVLYHGCLVCYECLGWLLLLPSSTQW